MDLRPSKINVKIFVNWADELQPCRTAYTDSSETQDITCQLHNLVTDEKKN